MITRKPLNINDDEIYDGMDRVEKPMSQPTTMSYSLQRIRLGEISRKIVDRTPLAAAHLGGLSHDDVMDIDTDVQILLNEIPSFFSMTTPQLVESFGLTLERAADIFYQGHTHHFLLYSQRCKLHLPYFTRGYVDTSFSTSRDLCLKSARFIIQSNLEMEAVGRETDKRFQFAGLLVGVFMASIVLLMDLCVNKSSLHHEQQRAEVAKAFKILDGAKNESPTTAKFVESLILILKKHKVTIPSEHLAGTCKRARTSQSENVIACDGLTPAPYTDSRGAFVSALESDGVGEGLVNSSIEDEDLSSYFDELAQSFEAGNDVGNFDWDNIFSGLNSSFI